MENVRVLAVLARSLAAFGKEMNASCGTAPNWVRDGFKVFSMRVFPGSTIVVLELTLGELILA